LSTILLSLEQQKAIGSIQMKIGKYRTSKAALLVLLVCITIASNVYSAPNIYYQGMLSGKAVIKVNGRSVKLTPGQTSKDGVKLLFADLESIVVQVEGKSYRYDKFSNQGIFLADAEAEEIILKRFPGSSGYWAEGRINGKDVTFLIDTGASVVVMNKDQARALKIKRGNNEIQVRTASKTETAYQVTLDTVSVGDIELKNIPAIIMTHKYPPYPLLGMSFLRHVEINQESEQMTLNYSAR
jgi:aspartyl protease family protein